MRILALDLATVLGWAHCDDSRVFFGSEDLGKGLSPGRLLSNYWNWLERKLEDEQPYITVFETPYVTGLTHQATARKLMGMACFTEALADQRALRIYEVNNASWRKHFCGVGSVSKKKGGRKRLKELTIEACRARGFSPEDDNQADALGILDYSMSCLLPYSTGGGPLFNRRQIHDTETDVR